MTTVKLPTVRKTLPCGCEQLSNHAWVCCEGAVALWADVCDAWEKAKGNPGPSRALDDYVTAMTKYNDHFEQEPTE